MAQHVTWLVHDLAEGHGHELQVRIDPPTFRGVQRGEQMILLGTEGLPHRRFVRSAATRCQVERSSRE